ncbi:MAG: hypothetical protein CTY15_13475 [Methylocystis sp.]|nr:MAG: hypothetical protein CTY15_13475 [Methylocystis sp.]
MDARTLPTIKTQGTVRIRNLTALPDVAAELGADFKRILAQAGLEANVFANPDNVISYLALGRLMRECMDATGCDELGLRVGMRQSIPVLGLSGYVAANAPTVRDALGTLISALRLTDTGGKASLAQEQGFATISWVIADPHIEAPEQIDDAAIAICCNIMRALCGPQWAPVEACLTRRRPANPAGYAKFFNAPLRFEADVASLIFDESQLDLQVEGRDANLHAILAPLLDKAMAEAGKTFRQEVCDLLRVQILTGPLAPDRVASAMGMSARTLSRHLASEQITFSELAQQVRFETAQRLLRSEKSISDIAAAMGYSDATAFIRAFRQFTGTTPARWRREM